MAGASGVCEGGEVCATGDWGRVVGMSVLLGCTRQEAALAHEIALRWVLEEARSAQERMAIASEFGVSPTRQHLVYSAALRILNETVGGKDWYE